MTKIGFRIGSVMSRKVAERAGAVDRGRLDELARDLGQAGVDRDRHERDRAPDDDRGDHGEALPRVREPVVVVVALEADAGQRPVEDAELVVDHPAPDVDRDDRRHRPREHERRRDQQAHERAEPREQERDQRPEHHRQGDGHRGERHRPEQHRPELAVAEDRLVVVEADPLALVLDQLDEPVLLEREREQAVHRVAEHGHDHDERRQHEEVRRRRAAGTTTPSSRPRDRLDGGKDGLGGEVAHAERQLTS